MSRTSISWGIPLPWDPKHVAYVWFDALFNYCTAVGYGDRPRAVRRVLAGRLPPHRQGHPPPPRVYWPAMLMAAGDDPPKGCAHGWLLVGGEKMSKTQANQIAPADLVADFGVDGFRYHFLADQRFGPDGDFSYEAMVARYNGDLANNFGNLANRVLNMAANYCGGVGAGRREDGPLASRRGDRVRRHCGRMASTSSTSRAASARSGSSSGDTNSYIEDRTSRGRSTRRATPPRSRRCSATASRRCGSSRCSRRR